MNDATSRGDQRQAAAAVGTQVALLAWLSRPARGDRPVLPAIAGRVVSLAGVAVAAVAARALGASLTPSPMPTAQVELHRAGPFALVRHPIYSGLLLFAGGRVLTAGPGRLLPCGLLWVLLLVKARLEERLLDARFPDYRNYAATTPRFVPAHTPGK